ncbi:hypothetical protein P368_14550 [Comamonas thiooxydans]|uniref:Uncharacterized protein n=1 Tax=Comamonas thiooxydans TaxID=363952 RepID=A0A096C4C9_9BURK|nr:hypothetical protein P609_18720 [Comamonas thiooxydans]KGG88097.1 hypothetical protein P245_18985 [Comamonas thiooxydans]KGG88633.1 hypothetical protein P369_17000 [Comamonas thiooxydans]KGG99540.1 hypothetical protein P367_09995 [Comamonas thiooxydans]KGH03971.1 hypothetical protein P365_15890 [Comamonas thiooxydans]
MQQIEPAPIVASTRSWLTYPKQSVKDDFEQVRMKNV